MVSMKLCYFFFLFFFVTRSTSITDTIQQGEEFVYLNQLFSNNGFFILKFFTFDGTQEKRQHYLGLFYNPPGRKAIWVANRNNPITNTDAKLAIDEYGNLKISNNSADSFVLNSIERAISKERQGGNRINASATLQNDGNFVLREMNLDGSAKRVLWQSFDYPTDTLLPGMKLGMNFKTGRDWTLNSWIGGSNPSQGSFTLGVDPNNTNELIIWWKDKIYWKSGTWKNGSFEFIPALLPENGINRNSIGPQKFRSVCNENECYYTYSVLEKYTLQKYTIESSGLVMGRTKSASFGNCYPSYNHVDDGCVKDIKLPECRHNTAEGRSYYNMIYGDPLMSDENHTLSLLDCRYKCWSNCSCTAYASMNDDQTGCQLWSKEMEIRVFSQKKKTYHYRDTQTQHTKYYWYKDTYTHDSYTDQYRYQDSYTDQYSYQDTYTDRYRYQDTYADQYRYQDTYADQYRYQDSYADQYHYQDSYADQYRYQDTYTQNRELYVFYENFDVSDPVNTKNDPVATKISVILLILTAAGVSVVIILCSAFHLIRKKHWIIGSIKAGFWVLVLMVKNQVTRLVLVIKSYVAEIKSARSKRMFMNLENINKDGEKSPELRFFRFQTIAFATNNFAATNKLGEGGFGPVYKGKLKDGSEIAIKRLSTNSGQGIAEFKNELTLIARVQHTNLVRLVGCCIQRKEMMLMYEYMPNKSLDFFLFDPSRRSLLDWKKRYDIIQGISQGLLYLHKYSRLRMIHRDLKAGNILLDDDMNPKISDFGMARIFEQHESKANTNRVVGTYGYMSPEYAMEGLCSMKSDVFSFGVLLLEIISGTKNNSYNLPDHPLTLSGHAWDLWKQGKCMELMDPTLEESYDDNEVSRCIHVGLLSVQDNPTDRPTMSDIAAMISYNSIPLPEPKPPAFYFNTRASGSEIVVEERLEILTSNQVSITKMQAR